ncbi:hypothetical protein B0H12DRAFT_1237895, partial [Mycena haematopus]
MPGPQGRSPRSSPVPDAPRASTPDPEPDPDRARSLTPPPKRRVVDFDPEEDEWEDEDEQLRGMGATTHRSRHRAAPVIPVRKHRRVIVAGANDLAADLNDWEVEREERAEMLAEKHSMKVKEVRRRMLSTSTFKPKRKVSVYNAKISRIMADLNTGRGLGDRYKIPDIQRMVRDDPSMLDGFTEEEEKEMVDEMDARRKKTVMRLSAEITALAERCGMIGFAMFTRGHVHDTAVPLTVQSWGALDFFRETLKKDPADVAALFELWAVSRERGDIGGDSLREMQQECTSIIKTGLQAALGRTKVAMNYDNYVKSLVEGKNVGLVGWPEGVDFKRMSLQSAVGPLRILRDALKCGTCRWKILTAGEKKRLLEQFDEMVKNGEAQQKTKKPRVKKAVSSGSG